MLTPQFSPNYNPNYTALMFLLQEHHIHPVEGSDNLVKIQGNFEAILANKHTLKVNEWYVYIPTGSKVAHELLHGLSLYRDKDLNKDPNTKGYFESNRRVKTIKLRGQYSSGFMFPVSELESVVGDMIERKETSFDMIGNLHLCRKYIVYTNTPSDKEPTSPSGKKAKQLAKVNIVEGQFQFHEDTNNLRRELDKIYPNDLINVSFKYHGCLKGFQTIKMSDGSLKPVKNIEIGDEVLGFNHETNEFVPSKVTETFKNGATKIWTRIFVDVSNTNIQFESKQSYGNLTTPEHKYYVKGKGYIQAKDVQVGDELQLYFDKWVLPKEVVQFLKGKMLGDASLNKKGNYRNITISQKEDHLSYLEHCMNVCDIFYPTIDTRVSGYGTIMKRANSLYDNSFLEIYEGFIKDGKKVFPKGLKLTPIILAYWYMDDGSLLTNPAQKDRAVIAICAFSDECIDNIKESLDEYGFNNYSIYKDSKGYWRLRFNHSDAYILFNDIAQYIPPVMRYKLPVEFRDLPTNLLSGFTKKLSNGYVFLPVIKSHTKEEPSSSGKYDIETETHNYITSNILVHNSSAIAGNLLFNKPKKISKLKEIWYKLINKDLPTEQVYDYVASSRKVIKLANDDNPGYYNEDIWTHALESFKQRIPKGWTIYSELVGYLPSGGYIQNNYDYGCEKGTYKIIPYRITVTDKDGNVVELSPEQIVKWSRSNGLELMHIFYTGTVLDHYKQLLVKHPNEDAKTNLESYEATEKLQKEDYEAYKKALEFFRISYLQMLEAEYNEKDCPLCINQVPEEGIILRKLGHIDKFEAYKLKSKRFLSLETKELDAGVVDIEETGES